MIILLYFQQRGSSSSGRRMSESGFGATTGTFSSHPTSPMGTSPRLSKSNSILRGGVLFSGSESHTKNNGLGPGHYFVPDDHLLKKSFNARVRSPRASGSASVGSKSMSPRPRSAAGSPGSYYQYGDGGYSPSSTAGARQSSPHGADLSDSDRSMHLDDLRAPRRR